MCLYIERGQPGGGGSLYPSLTFSSAYNKFRIITANNNNDCSIIYDAKCLYILNTVKLVYSGHLGTQ